MKTLPSLTLILKNKKLLVVGLVAILFSCSLVFFFKLTSDAKRQYLYFGGSPNELTLNKILNLSTDYFKNNYFKSVEQLKREAELVEQQEVLRLNLPMNQQIRRTYFYSQPYVLSMAFPKSWEGRFEVKESDNQLSIKFLNGTSTWPLFDLKMIDKHKILKNEEKNIVETNEVVAVLVVKKNVKINSVSVDKLYKKMQLESEEIIKSIKIYKNQ